MPLRLIFSKIANIFQMETQLLYFSSSVTCGLALIDKVFAQKSIEYYWRNWIVVWVLYWQHKFFLFEKVLAYVALIVESKFQSRGIFGGQGMAKPGLLFRWNSTPGSFERIIIDHMNKEVKC